MSSGGPVVPCGRTDRRTDGQIFAILQTCLKIIIFNSVHNVRFRTDIIRQWKSKTDGDGKEKRNLVKDGRISACRRLRRVNKISSAFVPEACCRAVWSPWQQRGRMMEERCQNGGDGSA
jgi:hypothetical protein